MFDEELIIHERPRGSLCNIPRRARKPAVSLCASHLAGLQVDKVENPGNAVLITARSRAADAACRRCGLSSARVNSRYLRRLQDLAAGGRAVMIDLEVRRFFCVNPACALRTFAEQVPAVTNRISAGHRSCAACWKRSHWPWPGGPGPGWPGPGAPRCPGPR